MKRVIYDPPEGWRYGFPKPYLPLTGEEFRDTLKRDGYPEKLMDIADRATRFWEEDAEEPEQEPKKEKQVRAKRNVLNGGSGDRPKTRVNRSRD